MISFMRSMFQSRIGIAITLAFLALIAVAFASADITGSSFGGVAGGDSVAKVGSRKIGTAELNRAVTNAYDREREQNPTLTMQQFISTGAVDVVLDQLIERTAIFEFGRQHGMIASDALIGSELTKLPAFRGPDGNFSEQTYRQVLQQAGLSDKLVREDIAQGLVSTQLMFPAEFGARAPVALAAQYSALRKELRKGALVLVPSTSFVPAKDPAADTLAAYYKTNSARYTLPERRTLRYATFGGDALKDVPAPTDAEIAKYYADNKAEYAPSEKRRVTQVILPTEAAAKTLLGKVSGGKSLGDAARAKGLLPSTAAVDKGQLTTQASAAVAEAVFAAREGQVATPAKSPLGWHVVHIDSIDARPARTLEQAKAEISTELATIKRRTALSDFTVRIQDELDGGGNLAQAAKELGITPATTAPLLANGDVYGKAGQKAPDEVARVIPTAFSMEDENEPQLAEVEPGKRFVIFEVATITPAAPPPLAEIKARVTSDWKLEQGSAEALKVADKLIAAIKGGVSLDKALAAYKGKTPAPSRIELTREELTAGQERVAPPLALMFSMAKQSTKRLEAPRKQGWFVVRLDDVVPGKIARDDPVIPTMQRELGQLIGREYTQQLGRALREAVGVEKNDAAIRAVVQRLTGN